ncbi:MAG TPA: TIGR03621 family F420-dependent LLM class oxidoreductase, partial [Candidatus Dormibacteraeota bacterium]
MPIVRAFRFGFNVRFIRSRDALAAFCRDAERRGYDTVLVPDHLGRNRPAPFPMLAAAAEATERLRIGTFVLNVGFWNPALLAREAATVDQLSGGRLELGLGAGHMKSEFDAAGLPWQPFGERVQRLTATIGELNMLFADEQWGYDTAQRPRPPLLVAGTGDRVLRLAARHADIVGYGGVLQAKGEPPGTFRIATAAEMDERVRFFRGAAGDRAGDVEANLLVQHVAVTDDRRGAAERFLGEYGPGLTVEEVLEAPVLLIGTVDQIAKQLLERRERFG